MDSKGRVFDNIFIEQFLRTIKYEEIYLHPYENVWEAERQIGAYINFYNHECYHSSLGDPYLMYYTKKKSHIIISKERRNCITITNGIFGRVIGDQSNFSLDWIIKKKQYRCLFDDKFGKLLFYSNREKWKAENIISVKRGQYHIEHIYRHLKNPYHHGTYPQYRCIDQRIHTLVCIMGLLLSQLLWQKTKEEG